jgi:hypothetical protein
LELSAEAARIFLHEKMVIPSMVGFYLFFDASQKPFQLVFEIYKSSTTLFGVCTLFSKMASRPL